MQPLVSPSQAKSAAYYAANYVSKDPFELTSCLPLLYQGQLEIRKYGSNSEDAGSASRNAIILIQKLLHKVNKIEVSAQQAASAMLGYDSFFFIPRFQFLLCMRPVKRFHTLERLELRSDENENQNEDNISLDNLGEMQIS